jgi:membrane protease YdiL (CAAX protease family)
LASDQDSNKPAEVQTTSESDSLPSPLPVPEGKVVRSTPKGQLVAQLLIFILVAFVFGPSLVAELIVRVKGSLHVTDPVDLLILESINLATVFGMAAIFARLERRRFGEYGLPGQWTLVKNFWLGAAFGFAEIAVLMGSITVFGGYTFGSLALHGGDLVRWGLVHLVLFLCVGLYEEFLFRGYLQFGLAQMFGFWPVAVALSLGFGLIHLTNKGETWVGAASVATIGLLFAFTLRRTGNLWYAVGLHTSFDWGESFLYSVPDSGEMLRGHLSNAMLHGPTWLTGGSVGPEGSVFSFVTMGMQFLVVMWLFPPNEKDKEEAV